MGITGAIYRNEAYFQVFEATLMVRSRLLLSVPDLNIPLSIAYQCSCA
jgi:hypothetical protein